MTPVMAKYVRILLELSLRTKSTILILRENYRQSNHCEYCDQRLNVVVAVFYAL